MRGRSRCSHVRRAVAAAVVPGGGGAVVVNVDGGFASVAVDVRTFLAKKTKQKTIVG